MARVAAYILVLACGLAAAQAAFAQKGGYAGLVAPAPDEKPAASAQKAPEPGYAGVVSGDVSDGSYTPKDTALQMSVPPGLGPLPSPKTSEDLKMDSLIYGAGKNLVFAPRKADASAVAALVRPSPRLKGMLPEEYAAEQSIEQAMAKVTDKKISYEARAENARRAYKLLSALADGMRHKKSMPDSVYQQMGVPATFIREQKEGAAAALVRLDAALEKLKSYQ